MLCLDEGLMLSEENPAGFFGGFMRLDWRDKIRDLRSPKYKGSGNVIVIVKW